MAMFTVEEDWRDGGAGDLLHETLFQTKTSSSRKSKRKRKRRRDLNGAAGESEASCEDSGQLKPKKRKSIANTDLKSMSNLDPKSADHGPECVGNALKLKNKMSSKLSGAKFRWINEQLYTTSSNAANKLFEQDPSLFSVYHQGFSEQTSKWPISPVDNVIAYVQQLPIDCIIADFGCGEAMLASSVRHTVHSFDLVASNDRVTACDMAHVPLLSSSVDLVVFCLSLMGTNVADFIEEGVRVLRQGGKLKICEIASRFTSVEEFVAALKTFGLKLTSKQTIGKMFLDFDFTLISKKTVSHSCIELKPCLYKRR